eukprot:103088_1
MSRRIKERMLYNDDKLPRYTANKTPRLTDKDRVIERVKWFRFEEPIEIMYEEYSVLIEQPIEADKPILLRGFEVETRNNSITKYAVMDIEHEDGKVTEDRCVNINDLHKEEYYDGIEGNEDGLVAIGFTTRPQLQKDKIDDPLLVYTHKIGEEVCINCPIQKKLVHGTITRKQLPTYWQQMNKKPYYFTATRQCDEISNGWIYQSMINSSGKYEQPSFKNVVVEKMLLCIQLNCDKYIKTTFISEKQYPFININTPYFGQKNQYFSYINIINSSLHYRPKTITYNYLRHAITKGTELKFNKKITDLDFEFVSATPKNCMMVGVYIDAYSMDKLLFHLVSDNIKPIEYLMPAITWDVTLTFCKNKLGLSDIIHENKDKSRIVLSPDKKLSMVYNRKTSSILLQKFWYFPENRGVVKMNNKHKNKNKNNTK